jgi:MFS family permease
MTELIAFRALQGVGGGGLMSVTMVVLGLLFPAGGEQDDKRSGTAGMGGIMVGLGIVLGPAVGGLVTDHLGRRWVFYINMPLGIGAFVTSAVLLRLPQVPVRARIDFLGAGLIAAAASALLVISQWGGTTYAWTSPTILALGGAAGILWAAFLWRQHSAQEPIFGLALLRNRIFQIMTPLGFFAGVGLAGSVAYLQGYLQEARGLSPAAAGLLLFPMAVGMTAVGLLSGRAMAGRTGRHRYQLPAGYLLIACGLLIFSLLGARSSLWTLGLGLLLLGIGLGLCLGIGLMITQSAVERRDLGLATTSVRFAQQLGAATGLALFGAVLNRQLAARPTRESGAVGAHGQLDLAALSSPALPTPQRDAALDTLISSTHTVFAIAACIMLLPAALATLLGRSSAARG